jgi:hypothetical protein
VKKIMERWRGWTSEETILDLWSRATGTPIEVLREGISRRDFIRGLGSVAGMAVSPKGLAADDDTGDYGPPAPWVPPDKDPRWDSSDWTGVSGFAIIPPDLVEPGDVVAGGAYTVAEYKEMLQGWREKDLLGSLTGQRATIVHGNPKGGHGLGLERFALDDDRGLRGRLKLPITWSLMYDEIRKRRLERT